MDPNTQDQPIQNVPPPVSPQVLPSRGWIKWVVLMVITAILSSVGTYFLVQSQYQQQTACTKEAKVCPDGSYVGRGGPKCEFAKCPSFTITPAPDPTTNWKTYTRNNTFEIKYPPHIKVYWDESNDSFIQFYREDIADPRSAGQGQGQIDPDRLCCGLSVYLRNPNGMEEMESRPQEDTTVAQYSASRWTDNPMYMEDVWVKSPKENIVVRFSITTTRELPEYQKEDFETYKQILSSFRFLDKEDADGKICGGFAGNSPEYQCPMGYKCQLDGNYPDASGKCVKE